VKEEGVCNGMNVREGYETQAKILESCCGGLVSRKVTHKKLIKHVEVRLDYTHPSYLPVKCPAFNCLKVGKDGEIGHACRP